MMGIIFQTCGLVFMGVLVSSLNIFEPCVNQAQCPTGSSCTYRGCDGKLCLCNDGLLPDINRTRCVQGVSLGSSCTGTSVCEGQPFSECINTVCECKDGYKQTTQSNTLPPHCLPRAPGNDAGSQFVDIGETCDDGKRYCSFDLVCKNGTCSCPDGERLATEKEMSASPYSYLLCRPNAFKLGVPINTSSAECKNQATTSSTSIMSTSTVPTTTTPSTLTPSTISTTTTKIPTTTPTTTQKITTPTTMQEITTPTTTQEITTSTTTQEIRTQTTTEKVTIPKQTSRIITPTTTQKITTQVTTQKITTPTTTTSTPTAVTTKEVTKAPSAQETTSLKTNTIKLTSPKTSHETSVQVMNATKKGPTTESAATVNVSTQSPTYNTSPTTKMPLVLSSTSQPESTTWLIEGTSSNITVNIGDTCIGYHCPNNSVCEDDSCGERRCRCSLGYAESPDGLSCFKLSALGESCTGPRICQGPFTECTEGGICDCQNEYERSDTGKWCRLKGRWLISFPLLGESCSNGFFSSCYMDFEQDCVGSRCKCKDGNREVGDEDRLAMYPDIRQCRNSSYSTGDRDTDLCKNQLKQSDSSDLYDKAKAKIRKIQAAIIGGSVGLLVLVGILIGLIVLIRWKRRGKRQVIRDTSSMASSERYSFKIPRPFTHYVGAKEYDSQQIGYPNPTFQHDSDVSGGDVRPDVLNVSGDSSSLLTSNQQEHG